MRNQRKRRCWTSRGINPWLLAATSFVPSLCLYLHPTRAQQVQTGLHYFAAENLRTGNVEQRGEAGSNGVAFDNLILAPDTPYRLWVLQAATLQIDAQSLITPSAGQTVQAPDFVLRESTSPDADGDGLHDEGEFVMGTDGSDPDSDDDGIPDGPEVRQGTNPLDGFPARTGIIGSADTPGIAKDVSAFNDVTVVADASGGVSVFNVFNGMDPIIIAQVDTPGRAERVAFSGNLVAAIDDTVGLLIIDVADPPAARIVNQIAFDGRARAVVTGANITYVGLNNGKVLAVDMLGGSTLAEISTGGVVDDLRLAGDILYVLLRDELQLYELSPDFLQLLGRIQTSSFLAELLTGGKRLFAAGGLAYATVEVGYDVVDVSDPARMRLVGLAQNVGQTSFKQIVTNGSGLGLAAVGGAPRDDGTHHLSLYDVSDPAVTTAFRTTFTTPGLARAVSLFNGLAYVADSESGLHAINYLAYDALRLPPAIAVSTNFAAGRAEEGQIMRVTADVTDDVQVRNVEFYMDGVKIATDGNVPFEHRFVVPTLAERSDFTLRARASDTGGNATFTDEMPFTIVADATPPQANALSPRDDAITGTIDAVAVFFSEPIDPASLGGFSVSMRTEDGTFVPVSGGRLEYRDEINGAFLSFDGGLPLGRYRAELPVTVTDLAGNPLAAPVAWNFTRFDLGEDRDQDCVPDSLEVALGLDPDNDDSDDDGTRDGDEDFDRDGLTNCGEVFVGTDPGRRDTDRDGVADGNEDTDGDAISDGEEVTRGADGLVTDPLLADTDGDGLEDGTELAFDSDPTDASDVATDVVIEGRTVVASGRIRLNSLTLRNAATLTHPAATSSRAPHLELEVAGTLAVDATSAINVTGKGFLGGRTGDNAVEEGRTLGNTSQGGSGVRVGGSYGGLGAAGIRTSRAANAVYGSFRDPNVPGSGGGTENGCALPGNNSGGGLVRITAQAVQLDGAIIADGTSNLTNGCAGGGSGGGVRLVAGTLSGSGSVRANGGAAHAQAGGGGGGRIALYYDDADGFDLASLRAFGGEGLQRGGPGTVFTQRSGQRGQLVIRGSGRESPLPSDVEAVDLTIDGATVSATSADPATLRLLNGAVLTHPPATTGDAPRLEVVANILVVDGASRIDVSGRGFLGGLTGDNAVEAGRTFGNTTEAGSRVRVGGSYGGLGAVGIRTSQTANAAYGSFRDPNEPGSGGGTESGCTRPGDNSGGGLVRITAQAVQLDGAIVADGASNLTNGCAGGGSGGGIKLEVETFSGSGSMRANGGAADEQAGGGGGGRIAVHYTDASGFDFANLEAVGGAGLNTGGVGTIFLRETDMQLRGDLVVDGKGQQPSRATSIYSLQAASSTAITANALTDEGAAFIPGTLIGLELNPNLAQEKTFTVIANDTTTLVTDPGDGALTDVAAIGDSYGAEPSLNRLEVSGHAILEIVDGDRSRADRRGSLSTTDLALTDNARLTHPEATTASFFGLELNVLGALVVDATSAIDVTGRGFLGGQVSDNDSDFGRTIGNAPGSSRRVGGSDGGLGGLGSVGGTPNPVYGDARDPNEPGSGGGAHLSGCFLPGANGGGLVRIVAQTAQLDGAIVAHGHTSPTNRCAGGGSGGGIKIVVAILSGGGAIGADGGAGGGANTTGGGGGGGRVAIFVNDASGFNLGNVTATGGAGFQPGQNGTVVAE
jgi:hypothetical protein